MSKALKHQVENIGKNQSGMTQELSNLSQEDRKRIARLARRNVTSEFALIVSAGFSFLMVVLFFFGDRSFLLVAQALALPPTLVWIALAASGSFLWAFFHVVRMLPKVHKAREINAALIYEYQKTLTKQRDKITKSED